MQTTYLDPSTSLTYTNGGLDGFGRIINHCWMKGSTPLVHILHGYDFSGNRLYRNDVLSPNISELYTYDQINQIKNLDRGILNVNKDAVTVSNFTETWNFDKTGNWLQYDKNGTIENRTHNVANELQGIAMHDANGNMTLMPGLKGKYDAWNRLVEVRDSSDNLIARYDYNGKNQRIKKTIGSTVTKSFFNEQWQELESLTGSELTSYVWSLRYIDDIVLRERDTERLYSLADPNWNVVALVDATGAVQERMKYDAFGKITWLDDDFVTKLNSDFSWNRTFTGQVVDFETGLMFCKNRFYHTVLGRFVSRDPIGYKAQDISLYRYIKNAAPNFYDPFGLEAMSSVPSKPPAEGRENFYLCWQRVPDGGASGQATAHVCNCQHTDIYGDQSGKLYQGFGGGQPIVVNAPKGLPGPEWTCKQLSPSTVTIIPGAPGDPSTIINKKIEWGPEKCKSCEEATDDDIRSCLRVYLETSICDNSFNCYTLRLISHERSFHEHDATPSVQNRPERRPVEPDPAPAATAR